MAEQIFLVGIGMGNRATLTIGALEALKHCDCLIGAQRMLDAFPDLFCEKVALTRPEQIAAYVSGHPEYRFVGVVFSGDVGFYSGARKLRHFFGDCRVEEYCGVSTVAYFCAKLHTSWDDAKLISAHGKTCNLAGEVRIHQKVFVLSGIASAGHLCAELCHAGLENVTVSVGERLSYPEETITTGTAAELVGRTFDPLSVLLIQNSNPLHTSGFGLPDDAFLRANTPMTKSEVRCVSLSRLRLEIGSIVWDIGAGTGSVSVEMALQAPCGLVYAVERDADACRLIEKNREKFGLSNLQIIHDKAPEALLDLPAPDRVFIGGGGRDIAEILQLILKKNPNVRVVVNAITLETVALATEAMEKFGLIDVEISQMTVARAKRVGAYHMMMGQNPVYIISGQGAGVQ